ncbi:hypothetical protein [Microbulbifer halophilus]|uniref:hypothetical protein n=1 Tax=Microbulbifer halophilus TaxID=453963 RepID=UPI00361B32E5
MCILFAMENSKGGRGLAVTDPAEFFGLFIVGANSLACLLMLVRLLRGGPAAGSTLWDTP